ncbi:MAG: serine/threonine-protein kinase [Planctomycetota bacterium]
MSMQDQTGSTDSVQPDPSGTRTDPLVGTVVAGRYSVLGAIGEGGFGVVYEAEQAQPIRRRVAIKILKPGMDSKSVLARFEAERQALAVMDHPCIATVLDAGQTGPELGGLPFFVMELVRGTPITDYCDTHRLTVEQRLELFAQVCDAVQHAHTKAIIHRDIKPSNILVEISDSGEPAPKVIDFGIAKATAQKLTEKTLFTERGQLIGTPEYMSPEQAEMSGEDIDTRSDVYSLGVLLYELLTGERPFDLRRAALVEIQRVIREMDPPKPSTRLTRQDGTGTRIAECRRTDLKSLTGRLRRELEWIPLRALRKDRTERYRTAADLADDVRRYLRGEALEAGPESSGYRLRKLVRRNKGVFASAAAVAASLLLGLAGTGYGLLEARSQEQRARAAAASEAEQREQAVARAEEAEAARKRAEAAEAETAQRAEELELVSEFQASQLGGIDVEAMGIGLRRSLLDAVPEVKRAEAEQAITGVNFTSIAIALLDQNTFSQSIGYVNEQFKDQPLLQARMLYVIATTAQRLGLLERADDPLTRSLSVFQDKLGNEHPDTLRSMNAMGRLLQSQGKLAEAESYFRSALEDSRRVLGNRHPDTLTALRNMAGLLHAQDNLFESESLFREALASSQWVLGDDHPTTLAVIDSLGNVLRSQGRLREAAFYMLRAMDGFRRELGDTHPSTLASISNMGSWLDSQGRLAEAEPYMREAMDGFRRILGDDHPSTLASMYNLGNLLTDLRRYEDAEPYLRESMQGYRRLYGEDHHDTLDLVISLGEVLYMQEDPYEAEPYIIEAAQATKRVLGPDHPTTLRAIHNMGVLHFSQHRFAKAEMYHRESLEGNRRVFGAHHIRTLTAIEELSETYMNMGRRETRLFRNLNRAVAEMTKAYDLCLAGLGSEDDRTRNIAAEIASYYDEWHTIRPDAGHDASAAEWRVKAGGE